MCLSGRHRSLPLSLPRICSCPCPFPTRSPPQAAKFFAEHFAAVWERKERESGIVAQQLHRSEVGAGQLVDGGIYGWVDGLRPVLPPG